MNGHGPVMVVLTVGWMDSAWLIRREDYASNNRKIRRPQSSLDTTYHWLIRPSTRAAKSDPKQQHNNK